MSRADAEGIYIGKAKNPSQASNRPLLSPLQRLRQRTGSDDAGLFATETEACSGAMTLARRWGERHRRGECGVVLASGGRFDAVIETISTTCTRVPFNDLAAMNAAIDSDTVAIVLEPIQGQTVITPASQAYVQGVASLCRALNILLIFNDAQGTTGPQGGLLCEDAYGVRADIAVLGDHSSCSPRSAALLVRGRACMASLDELPGFIHEPTSATRVRPTAGIRPSRQPTLSIPGFEGLLA